MEGNIIDHKELGGGISNTGATLRIPALRPQLPIPNSLDQPESDRSRSINYLHSLRINNMFVKSSSTNHIISAPLALLQCNIAAQSVTPEISSLVDQMALLASSVMAQSEIATETER